MSITIFPPLAFSEVGQRQNNEDFFLPQPPDTNTRLFVVCDGMGGLDKGEEASRITAESVAAYLAEHATEDLTEADIQRAVEAAFLNLRDYMDDNSLISRMGSTLTLLHLNDTGATIAYVGDSRVYHIRNGEILYKTKDHKQVLDMVKDGIITPEQALHHPWRNRLSRSVSVQIATAENPNPRKPDKATVQQLTDISPNDYFFLCTDGVLEQLTDEMLCQLLNTEQPNEEKKAAILTICEGKTKDNYTGLLVQVDEVRATNSVEILPVTTDETNEKIEPTTHPQRSGIVRFILLLLLILGLVGGGYYWRKFDKNETAKIVKKQTENSPLKDPKKSDKQAKKDSVPRK